MSARNLVELLNRVEAAALDRHLSVTTARAAVATLLYADQYGWPSAREPLSEPEWDRLLWLLDQAGEPVPDDFMGPGCRAELVPREYLGDYGHGPRGGSLLALPGRRFVVTEYLTPRLRPGVAGAVDSVRFVGSRWRVCLRLDGQQAAEYVPLGMFVSCTMPPELLEGGGNGRGGELSTDRACGGLPAPRARPGGGQVVAAPAPESAS